MCIWLVFKVILRNSNSLHMFGATVATLACHPVAGGCRVMSVLLSMRLVEGRISGEKTHPAAAHIAKMDRILPMLEFSVYH